MRRVSTKQLKERRGLLEAELEKGQEFLQQLQEKRESTITTIRRIEGALTLLNELIGNEE